MNLKILEQHLIALSHCCTIEASSDLRLVRINDVRLPPGWNKQYTSVLLEIPSDYPLTAPGQGSNKLYLANGLRFRGATPRDYSENDKPGWAWWCYEKIHWNRRRDDLITLLEMLRTDLSSPRL